MAEQIPLPAKLYPGLPELSISDRALAKFTIDMMGQLHDFELRFAEPRQHPRLSLGRSRGPARRPR